MKPSAFRIERLLANVEAEVERRGLRRAGTSFILTRSLRQKRSLPYVLVPRVLSSSGMDGAVWKAARRRSR